MNLALLTVACGLIASSLEAAVLYGRVLDANRHPVVDATVSLRNSLGTRTDADGTYRFENLAESTYFLRVEKAGFSHASAGPFTLTPEENKNVDITLSPKAPDFFDEPKFVVAGVTAGGYQGGHGSDVVLRSAESLAKEAAALSADPTHRRPADTDENQGKFVDAAREYQRAAELDPSEPNLFDWGAELLRHHADAQAIEVFRKANLKYPGSMRILLGLATANYSLGTYDQASKYFFAAADANPSDSRPYLFLAKVRSAAITETIGFRERMERFATLQPANAEASYVYAACLWEQRQNTDDSATAARVRTLLQRAIELDPQRASAYLLLGIVDSDATALERAIAIDPKLEEAHYRLSQIYRQTAQPAKARKELAIYEQLRKDSAERVKQERNQLQQFVFDLRQ